MQHYSNKQMGLIDLINQQRPHSDELNLGKEGPSDNQQNSFFPTSGI
jgi:hypothetical protein